MEVNQNNPTTKLRYLIYTLSKLQHTLRYYKKVYSELFRDQTKQIISQLISVYPQYTIIYIAMTVQDYSNKSVLWATYTNDQVG
jgi:hypothetical protein